MSNKVCPKNCLGNCKECELAENKLKAFDIINNKGVDILLIKRCDNVDQYNSQSYSIKLTTQDFEIIKGAIKC